MINFQLEDKYINSLHVTLIAQTMGRNSKDRVKNILKRAIHKLFLLKCIDQLERRVRISI